MAAREKLNSAYLIGATLPAVVLGWITGSWTVFAMVATAVVGVAMFSGGIRPPPPARRR